VGDFEVATGGGFSSGHPGSYGVKPSIEKISISNPYSFPFCIETVFFS